MTPWSWLEAPPARQLSLAAAVRVHAQVQLARTLRLRGLWPWLALALAVALGGWAIVRFSVESAERYGEYVRMCGINAVALVALGLGTSALRQDAEAGALAFFLLRPRAPIALPLGRWLAVSLVAAGLGAACLGTLWLVTQGSAAALGFGDLLRMLLAALLAGLTYTAVFIAFAVWQRAAVGVSVGWLVVGDGMAKKSDAFAALAPSHYLAAILGHATSPSTSLARAALSLLVLAAVALAAAVVRLQRDPPIVAPP